MKIAKTTAKTSRPPTLAVIIMISVQFRSLSPAHKSFGYICGQQTGYFWHTMFEKVDVMNNNYTASIYVHVGL